MQNKCKCLAGYLIKLLYRVCTVSLTGQISVTGQRPVYDRGHAVRRPSRIYALKWAMLKQNPSIFGWDMTQNSISLHVSTLTDKYEVIFYIFWVISQSNVVAFCLNMNDLKAFFNHGQDFGTGYNLGTAWPVRTVTPAFFVPKRTFCYRKSSDRVTIT